MSSEPKRRPERDLSGKQRRHLRAIAHHHEPLVKIGKDGVTDGVIDALRRALHDHELVKVRVFDTSPDERAEAIHALATACGAHEVASVGKILVLYRMREEDPSIELPRR